MQNSLVIGGRFTRMKLQLDAAPAQLRLKAPVETEVVSYVGPNDDISLHIIQWSEVTVTGSKQARWYVLQPTTQILRK